MADTFRSTNTIKVTLNTINDSQLSTLKNTVGARKGIDNLIDVADDSKTDGHTLVYDASTGLYNLQLYHADGGTY